MKLKIPKSFRMLGDKVRVIIVSNLDSSGQNCPGDQYIKIKKDMSPQWQRQTFMHELLEYALRKFGCEIQRRHEEHQYLISHAQADIIALAILEAFETMEY